MHISHYNHNELSLFRSWCYYLTGARKTKPKRTWGNSRAVSADRAALIEADARDLLDAAYEVGVASDHVSQPFHAPETA